MAYEQSLQQITDAFGPSPPAPRDDIAQCYQGWLEAQAASLGPPAPVVLPDMAAKKADAIRRADASQKKTIFHADGFASRLAPIDRRAADWAGRVLDDGKLTEIELERAQRDKDELTGILTAAKAVIQDRSALGAIQALGSEVYLDLLFALNGGGNTISLRLARRIR